MNWHRGIGGGGAIDLVMHLNHLDFPRPCRLARQQHFPAGGCLRHQCHHPQSQLPALPSPDPSKLGRVQRLPGSLSAVLPAPLVDPLIQSGSLYADTRANAVFLLRGPAKPTRRAPNCAAPRPRPWRGMAPGSRKDLGFFSVPAIPCYQASSSANRPSMRLSCSPSIPSTAASPPPAPGPIPAGCTAFMRPRSPQVYCGFDADPTGDDHGSRHDLALIPPSSACAPPSTRLERRPPVTSVIVASPFLSLLGIKLLLLGKKNHRPLL